MKIFLGVLGILALVGTAFGCLAIYAKKEILKPKFEIPEPPETVAVSSLPASKQEAFDYVNGLFTERVSCNDAEISEHTGISLGGEKQTPFSDADSTLFSRALEQAQGKISELYPTLESVPVTKLDKAPELGFTSDDIIDFTAEKGVTDENGETNDDGYYYISFELKPDAIDTEEMLSSEVEKAVAEQLDEILSISSAEIAAESFTAKFKIRYADDSLEHIEIRQNVTVKAQVEFKDDYKRLSEGPAKLELPLEKTRRIDVFSYGLRFIEKQLALQTGRTLALPLEVRVNSETTKDDYKINFTASQDGILDIDADGVMEVVGASEKPVTVTAVLEYDGHTYSDSITVYATDLEVKTDEP
jgi:hypothetical protein